MRAQVWRPGTPEAAARRKRRGPAKGAELLLKLSEMFVPRPVRQSAGAVEKPLTVEVRTYGDNAPHGLTVDELERIAMSDTQAAR